MRSLVEPTWYILEDPERPGEYITLTAAGKKYVLAWLNEAEARAFLKGNPAAQGMQPASLGTRELKRTFLEAAKRLDATHVLFSYLPGMHQAPAASIAALESALVETLESLTG